MANIDLTNVPFNTVTSFKGKIGGQAVISKVLQGEELIEMNKRLQEQNPNRKFFVTNPYIMLHVTGCSFGEVMATDPAQIMNEKAFQSAIGDSSHVYLPKNEQKQTVNDQGFIIKREFTTNFAPSCFVRQPDNSVNPIVLQKELEPGTPVTIIVRAYESHNSPTGKGYGVDGIIIEDPNFRYKSANGMVLSAFAKLGIVVNDSQAQQPADPETNTESQQASQVQSNEPIVQAPTQTVATPQENNAIQTGFTGSENTLNKAGIAPGVTPYVPQNGYTQQ